MKLKFNCVTCVVAGKPSDDKSFDFCEAGIYKFICAENHSVVFSIDAERYDLLLYLGIRAIGDGYYREAIANFAVSLERFYEFALKVFFSRSGGKFERWVIYWKELASASERQLGAFYGMHFSVLQKEPVMLSNAWRERRNAAVHKGRFATKDEATEFGREVHRLIALTLCELLKDHREHVENARFWSARATVLAAGGEHPNSATCPPLVLTPACYEIEKNSFPESMSFDALLKRLAQTTNGEYLF